MRLVRENDVVGRARIDEELSVAVEDRTARCGDRDEADPLVLGPVAVIIAVDDLQVIKPGAEDREQNKRDDLDRRDPEYLDSANAR